MIKETPPKFKWNVTDPSLFGIWLSEKRLLSPSSTKVYIETIMNFLTNDNPNIEKVDDYNRFLIRTTIKKRAGFMYSAIKAYIDFKITDLQLREQIKAGLIKPKSQPVLRDRKYLTEEQIFEVVNKLERPKHRVMALIQELTGVRAGDIFNLKIGDINPEIYEKKEVLRLNIIGKGRKRNVVFIHDKVAQELIMTYIRNLPEIYEDFYFQEPKPEVSKKRVSGIQRDRNASIKKMNYKWYWLDLKQALNYVGIDKADYSTHDFRRCFARRVWEKYKDIHILQHLLNHSNPTVTLKYLEQSGLQNIDYHFEMQQ